MDHFKHPPLQILTHPPMPLTPTVDTASASRDHIVTVDPDGMITVTGGLLALVFQGCAAVQRCGPRLHPPTHPPTRIITQILASVLPLQAASKHPYRLVEQSDLSPRTPTQLYCPPQHVYCLYCRRQVDHVPPDGAGCGGQSGVRGRPQGGCLLHRSAQAHWLGCGWLLMESGVGVWAGWYCVFGRGRALVGCVSTPCWLAAASGALRPTPPFIHPCIHCTAPQQPVVRGVLPQHFDKSRAFWLLKRLTPPHPSISCYRWLLPCPLHGGGTELCGAPPPWRH